MNNANCLTFITVNIKGIQNNSKRLFVVEYFRNKLIITEFGFYKKHNPHLMMKIFGKIFTMDLSFTHMVPLNPAVSSLLILEISTFRLTNKWEMKMAIFLFLT